MPNIRCILLASMTLAGALICGCHAEQSRTLGVVFTPGAIAPIQALASSKQSTPVVVQGEMIEKCPVAGCWFMLKDQTGVVRVDTKAAGFVVSEVPLHARLTVAGTLTPGAQPGIAATGVRY